MSVLSRMFRPSGNIEDVCFLVCELLSLRYTSMWLQRSLRQKPFYPSMLSIYDVLCEYGIRTEAYKCELKKLENVSCPFIVQVANGHNGSDKRFALVLNATNGFVTWTNPYNDNKRESIPMNSFSPMFTGYAMFFEAGKDAGEKDYWQHLREEIAEYVTTAGMVLFLPILFIVAVLWHFLVAGSLWVSPCVYGGLLLVGCCVGGLLLAQEYDAYSPVVRRFCGSGGRVSCDAVISSKGSTLWGIPWTVIGGGYFVGSLSALTVSCLDTGVVSHLAWVHVMALPYIGYSLYYQKRVVGQWCPLCLTVLAVIASLFVTALLGDIYGQWREITLGTVLCVTCSLCLASSWLLIAWKYGFSFHKGEYWERSFKQVKYNPDVFKSLLHKGKKVDISTDGYGIMLGNPNGSIRIIEVSNPYCGHCATAQPILQKLVDEHVDVCIQMIFTANPKESHYKDYPVDIFLSLYNKGEDMSHVMKEWYVNMDMTSFKRSHGVNGSDKSRNETNACAMYDFCVYMGIIGTPTIFINGYELPKMYSVSDLLYLITN